jgi:hypothetical protein
VRLFLTQLVGRGYLVVSLATTGCASGEGVEATIAFALRVFFVATTFFLGAGFLATAVGFETTLAAVFCGAAFFLTAFAGSVLATGVLGAAFFAVAFFGAAFFGAAFAAALSGAVFAACFVGTVFAGAAFAAAFAGAAFLAGIAALEAALTAIFFFAAAGLPAGFFAGAFFVAAFIAIALAPPTFARAGSVVVSSVLTCITPC